MFIRYSGGRFSPVFRYLKPDSGGEAGSRGERRPPPGRKAPSAGAASGVRYYLSPIGVETALKRRDASDSISAANRSSASSCGMFRSTTSRPR